MAGAYDLPRWQIASVTDTLVRGSAGEEMVLRAWHPTLGDDQLSFTTCDSVLAEPKPLREEQLGRALATYRGWEVRDIAPDLDGASGSD